MSTFNALPWYLSAVAKWLVGLLTGLLISLLVAALVAAFPALGVYSVDRGIQLKSAARLATLTQGEKRLGIRGYVFLDIDAGGASRLQNDGNFESAQRLPFQGLPTSEASCLAMALRRGERTRSGPQVGEALRSATGKVTGLRDLDCHELRSPNRFLLASMIDELRERGARLIIVDVILANDVFPFSTDETRALAGAIERTRDRILLPAPIYPVGDAEDGRQAMFRELTAGPIVPEALMAEISGSAFPGVEPVRAFPACVHVQSEEGTASKLPSLPLLAAVRLRGTGDVRSICAKAGNSSSQLDYSLVGQTSHVDEFGVTTLDSRELATARVANRCLGEYFWMPEAVCGQRSQFRGKVVIIGASNPVRRDRFSTPLGAMSGPELQLNGLRSYLAHPDPIEPSFMARVMDEVLLGFVCSLVWLLAWLRLCSWDARPTSPSRVADGVRRTVVVMGAFVAICVVTFSWSFIPGADEPRLDVLIPFLGIGLEPIAAGISKTSEFIENRLAEAFKDWWPERWIN